MLIYEPETESFYITKLALKSLWSGEQPWTCDPSASTTQELELQAYATVSGFMVSFFQNILGPGSLVDGLFSMYKSLGSIPTHPPPPQKKQKEKHFLVMPYLSMTLTT